MIVTTGPDSNSVTWVSGSTLEATLATMSDSVMIPSISSVPTTSDPIPWSVRAWAAAPTESDPSIHSTGVLMISLTGVSTGMVSHSLRANTLAVSILIMWIFVPF